MSFFGRSAEDVYRYALRRDRDARSLSDGFGFSIVLINDESPVCVQFLLDYFKQLSHRTANRVRFVFFGEMTEPETLARHQTGAGLGGQWISRVWRELQPAALELVEKPGETLARWIDQSAVPDGTGAAIQFAQRLGVAEHVPCLVIFTDVGVLRVHVMPMRGLSAPDVFQHVCHWVDRFYADNHGMLDRWDDAEREIATLWSAVSDGLASVRTWRESAGARARELRDAAAAIRRCEGLRSLPPGMWRGRLVEISRGLRPGVLSAHLTALDQSLSAFATFSEVATRAREAGARLRAAGDADTILEAMKDLVATGVLLGREAERGIRGLGEELAAFRLIDPEAEWEKWREAASIRPSFEEYMKSTIEWQPLRTGQAKKEYSRTFRMVDDLNIGVSPEEGTRILLDRVVRQFDDEDRKRAYATSAEAKAVLRSHLQRLFAGMPDWLRAVPGVTVEQAKGLYPQVRAALDRRREEVSEVTREEAQRVLASAQAVRDVVLIALNAAMPMLEVREEHWNATLDRQIDMMRGYRQSTEQDLQAAIESVVSAGRPVDPIGPEKLQRLVDSLDQYDAAIASLVYDYERDPLVIRLPTETSVEQAVGLRPSSRSRPSHDVRARLDSAASTDQRIGLSFEEGIAEAEDTIPARSLDRVLRTSVTAERLLHLVQGANDPAHLLSQLLPEEMARVRNAFGLGAVVPAGGTSATVAEVLAAIGADPSGKSTVPVAHDFDVFLSYHKPRQAEVERIADALRTRGLMPWFDAWEIVPGSEFKGEIERALTRCRTFAVFIGPEGIGGWQPREISFACLAAKRGLRLVPVLIGGGSHRVVPVTLRAYAHVQLADAADSAGIDNLVRGLTHAMKVAA